MLQSSAEPRSGRGTVVSSSPLWHNVSIATNSAAAGVRGLAVVLKNNKRKKRRALLRLSSSEEPTRPRHAGQETMSGGGQLRSMDGRF